MVVPTIAVPNLHMPPPIQTGSFSGARTQTSVYDRLPIFAVPANPAGVSVYNNRQGQTATPTTASPPGSLLLSASGMVSTALATSGATLVTSLPFTSHFMAQMFGQGHANDNQVVASFFRANTLATHREMVAQFSETKYLPSRAAKPAIPPQGTAALTPPVPPPDAKPVAQPLRIQIPSAPPAATPPAVAESAAPAAPRHIQLSGSLVRPRGVQAYTATFSRNVKHLDGAEENPPIKLEL